jgi:polyribonucleotide nucleotidyltransferase
MCIVLSWRPEKLQPLIQMVDVAEFQSFNVSDLLEFNRSKKDYLFFADTRELPKDEKRYVNVIMNLSRRRPLVDYVDPKVNLFVDGVVENIHSNNKTAFIKLKKIKHKGILFFREIRNQYVAGIDEVLKVGQPIKAKIISVEGNKIHLTMKNVKQN